MTKEEILKILFSNERMAKCDDLLDEDKSKGMYEILWEAYPELKEEYDHIVAGEEIISQLKNMFSLFSTNKYI